MSARKNIAIPHEPMRKAYQVIISRLDGERLDDTAYRDKLVELVDNGIGGFIIFGGKLETIREFIGDMQARADIPLFIASDIERGAAQQIAGLTAFPSQMAVAAALDPTYKDDETLLKKMLEAIADESAYAGINMPLIPVLDVNRDPDNPIICTRAFSDNPDTVSRFGSIYIDALQQRGLISCPKHFPGHGDTTTDSHIALPVMKKTKDDLYHIDLKPFVSAVKNRADAIMIGHLKVPVLDEMPASLSKHIITGLLRTELGFEGLIVTDALNMHALKEFGDVPVECLEAGANVLLHPDDPDETVSALLSALRGKRLHTDILDSSVKRILAAKMRFMNNLPSKHNEIDLVKHSALSQEISQRSVTLLKDTSALLPLCNSNVRVIFAGDENYFSRSPFDALTRSSASGSNEVQVAETIIIVIFTSVSAWRGSSGISIKEKMRLLSIINNANKSIVVSFGSPYVLRHFSNADVLIAAYDATVQAQQAVIRCLKGLCPFTGKLPVIISEVSS